MPDDSRVAKRMIADSAWYVANINFSQCNAGMSPAERIKSLQESGLIVRTADKADSTGKLTEVEIAFDDSGQERYYRYYKSKEACVAALPANQPIPDKYR